MRLILPPESKDEESWVLSRPGRPEVRGIGVEGDQPSALLLARGSPARSRLATHFLLQDGHRIVSGIAEKVGRLCRQVLIELEPHAGTVTTRSPARSAA